MTGMTQLRIDIAELPAAVRKALEEGREVLFEDHGAVVARVAGCEKPKGGDLNELVKALRDLPPLDEDYERDMAQIASWINRPAEPPAWE